MHRHFRKTHFPRRQGVCRQYLKWSENPDHEKVFGDVWKLTVASRFATRVALKTIKEV